MYVQRTPVGLATVITTVLLQYRMVVWLMWGWLERSSMETQKDNLYQPQMGLFLVLVH